MFNAYKSTIVQRNTLRYVLGYLGRALIYTMNLIRVRKLRRKGARIGQDAFIANNCRVESPKNMKIGSSTVITTARLDARGGLVIGNHTIINDMVHIITASHDINSKVYQTIYSPVSIGNYCWIATGATILPGVKIGDGAVVGAMSVVTKDVQEMEVVAGNPAKVISRRKTIHDDLPLESLVGADFRQYRMARRERHQVFSGSPYEHNQ